MYSLTWGIRSLKRHSYIDPTSDHNKIRSWNPHYKKPSSRSDILRWPARKPVKVMLWLHKQYFYIALRMEYKTTMEGRAHGSSQQKYLAHDPGPRPSRERNNLSRISPRLSKNLRFLRLTWLVNMEIRAHRLVSKDSLEDPHGWNLDSHWPKSFYRESTKIHEK